ncbi:MAG: NAD(P)(+) transhydrogenase (Re/Si-specific) subunit alpha, partial [Thermoleophilia bacterium]|nr:NAD(P)(+) transhydrogenase (Re/Si-specific) subunit alpha [Thermoleophilia bacterium]
MKISVPAETAERETRVAIVPETVQRLARDGHEVVVGAGAGTSAGFSDADYSAAGASIAEELGGLLSGAD